MGAGRGRRAPRAEGWPRPAGAHPGIEDCDLGRELPGAEDGDMGGSSPGKGRSGQGRTLQRCSARSGGGAP